MRPQFLAVLAGLTSLALAQYNGLPKCAQACVGNSLVDYGCGNIQAECICKNKPLIAALACCVGKSCTAQSDVEDTQTFASAICAPYSVTLPASATCSSSGSGSASATPSASSSATPASASAGGALATGSAGTGSSNGTAASGSSSSSSATPVSTGGAPMQTMAAGLGAAAFGLLAVL